VSYFRLENAREIAPRSVCSLPNSTRKVSRKRGRVTASQIQLGKCLEKGVGSSLPNSTRKVSRKRGRVKPPKFNSESVSKKGSGHERIDILQCASHKLDSPVGNQTSRIVFLTTNFNKNELVELNDCRSTNIRSEHRRIISNFDLRQLVR
jgi:hypothetical protein